MLRLILGFALDAGATKSNPASQLKLERQQRQEMHFLSEQEVVTLASKMRNPMFENLVPFAAWIGMRAGEVGALRVKRFDFKRGRAEVAENLGEARDGTLRFGPTKTYSRRSVPVAPFLVERLAPTVARLSDDELVFRSPEGGPLRHHNFYRRAFKPALADAGLDTSIRSTTSGTHARHG